MKPVSKKTKKSKTPEVTINKELNKYADQVLFPEKLKEANRILKEVGVPKIE